MYKIPEGCEKIPFLVLKSTNELLNIEPSFYLTKAWSVKKLSAFSYADIKCKSSLSNVGKDSAIIFRASSMATLAFLASCTFLVLSLLVDIWSILKNLMLNCCSSWHTDSNSIRMVSITSSKRSLSDNDHSDPKESVSFPRRPPVPPNLKKIRI